MNQMHVVLQGRRWLLRFVQSLKNRGDCDSPQTKNKQIRVRSDLDGEERLEVIIHELLHAGGWHRDEEYVEQEAKDIAHILWRIGYRDTS